MKLVPNDPEDAAVRRAADSGVRALAGALTALHFAAEMWGRDPELGLLALGAMDAGLHDAIRQHIAKHPEAFKDGPDRALARMEGIGWECEAWTPGL